MLYWVKFANLQLRKKTTHLLQNCKYAFAENLYGHFCPRRKAANFCHPVQILADNSGPKLAPGLQSSPVGRHAGFNFPFITFVAGRYCWRSAVATSIRVLFFGTFWASGIKITPSALSVNYRHKTVVYRYCIELTKPSPQVSRITHRIGAWLPSWASNRRTWMGFL